MKPSPTLLMALLSLAALPAGSSDLTVELRSRLDPDKTAVIVCDMWDKHWCKGATERVGELVTRMAPFLETARKRGIQIIHAPSDTMDFYKDAQQRKLMLSVPHVEPPAVLSLLDPPLPIDDKRGGCDTKDQFYKAWTREHPGLRIDAADVISDKGDEIYSFLRQRGISSLLVMGVHANMCILNRSFAIKRMTALGIRCVLVRDLTDAMYNPEDAPYVSHQAGTQLVIDYIEKYWCSTVTSAELLRAFAH
jgi:nicotinamidase-related amidase